MRALIMLLCLYPATLLADHLPKGLVAQGKPETQLCSIEIEHTKVDELMKRFGEPTTYEKYPRTKDQAEITWYKQGARIHTYINVTEAAYAVAVSGTPNDLTSTGRKLGLGQTMADTIRIYGNRFRKRKNEVLLQWPDGTELRISFQNRRIDKLMLVAPVE